MVSSLLWLFFLFLLLLLTDAGAFEVKVFKCLLNIIGAGVLQLNTDTSVCVALETVWGGVSTLGSGALGCVGPQLRDGHKEGVDSLQDPFGSIIGGSMHGSLGGGGEQGRRRGP